MHNTFTSGVLPPVQKCLTIPPVAVYLLLLLLALVSIISRVCLAFYLISCLNVINLTAA